MSPHLELAEAIEFFECIACVLPGTGGIMVVENVARAINYRPNS